MIRCPPSTSSQQRPERTNKQLKPAAVSAVSAKNERN